MSINNEQVSGPSWKIPERKVIQNNETVTNDWLQLCLETPQYHTGIFTSDWETSAVRDAWPKTIKALQKAKSDNARLYRLLKIIADSATKEVAQRGND